MVAAAGLTLFLGYSGMAWTYAGYITPPFPALVLAYFLVGLGSSGVFNSTLSTVVRNFPASSRGLAVGVSVAFVGLSALVLSQLAALFSRSAAPGGGEPGSFDCFDFLQFSAVAVGLTPVVASLFLVDPKWPAAIAAVAAARGRTPPPQPSVTGAAADETRPLLEGGAPRTRRASRLPLFASDSDALLLFFAFLLVTGPGLMYINNIGTAVDTLLGYTDDTRGLGGGGDGHRAAAARRLQVGLISVCNAAGRAIFGALSDGLESRRGVPRVYTLVTGAGLVAAANIGAAAVADSIPTLTVCTVLLGLGYGATFGVCPTVVSLFFGLDGFGANWGWFQWGPALGGQLFNVLFGVVMDIEHGDTVSCDGRACYAPAFFAAGCAAAVSAFALAALQARRSRRAKRIELDIAAPARAAV
ncbi:hypothetical protein HK405_011539 [Cladochytrium tenue]|nr:hypothetical protein HK405_011539 [Cladochytrium tenue]